MIGLALFCRLSKNVGITSIIHYVYNYAMRRSSILERLLLHIRTLLCNIQFCHIIINDRTMHLKDCSAG